MNKKINKKQQISPKTPDFEQKQREITKMETKRQITINNFLYRKSFQKTTSTISTQSQVTQMHQFPKMRDIWITFE